MRAVTAFLLGLCFLAVSHAWTCNQGPVLSNAYQIDAGQGEVVARDSSYYPYFLIGSSWHRMSSTRFRHVSVGRAGLWATSTSNRVYKYVAGTFLASSGLSMYQLDAGGDQLVGVASGSYRSSCVRSTYASLYYRGSLSWTTLSRAMRYYSCGPLYGCWGVDTSYRVWVTKVLSPTSCGTSGWTYISGITMRMIEVGTDGSVFGLDTNGRVYQRNGISNSRREGTSWTQIPMCMGVRHLSYDLGQLWVVTTSGLVLKCTH